jgi:hypothetical protein
MMAPNSGSSGPQESWAGSDYNEIQRMVITRQILGL